MAKLNDIRALAENHAAEITRSTQTWTSYLDTAATLYRYDFSDSLLIHSVMADYLMDTYGLEYDPDASLTSVLMAVARAQAADNLDDAMDGLSYEIRGTYLEGLGDDAVRENFRRLLENSTFYMLDRRSGLNPWDELTPDDFSGIASFNRLSVLSFLGNAAHDIIEPVLRDIGREAIFHYRIIAMERKIDEYIEKAGYTPEEIAQSQKELSERNDSGYNKFNTLIRESVDGDQERSFFDPC